MNNRFEPEFAGKRIWMYWPGEKAYQFKENVEKDFMACGLPEDREVGDLDVIMNIRGGLDAALKETYGTFGDRKLLREFANVMQIGDFILARCEFDNIIGVGIVTGDYYYDESRPRFKHCRKVKWIDTNKWAFVDELKVNGKWHRVTMIDQHYRKIVEQIITWICEGADIDIESIQQSVKEVKRDNGHTNIPVDNLLHKAFMDNARSYQESIVRQWAKQYGNACIWDERPGHGVWLKDKTAKVESVTPTDSYFSKSLNRGVSMALIEAFKRSPLYGFYQQHSDELLIGVRNSYLNIYYRLNNIAEVRLVGDGFISCGIHPYFLRHSGNSNEVLTGVDIETLIIDRYEAIKNLVENKKNMTSEKVAQQMLVMQNNASPSSKWFCIDVEWARSFSCQAEKDSCISARMDIIAISKEAPHRVAVIELKYGSKSISGDAGILKHIQDFKTLKEGSIHDGTRIDYYDGICTDICNILNAYNALGIALPESLKSLSKERFASQPEFYVLTVDNNPVSWGATTPKQTMAAYLFSPNSFNYLAWDCRQPAKDNVQEKLGINVLDASSSLPVTFIFSEQNVTTLQVNDILEDNSYEIIRPAFD